MKNYFFCVLFLLLLPKYSLSKEIPKEVYSQIQELEMKSSGVLYTLIQEECASCNYAELKVLNNYAEIYEDKVYLIFSDQKSLNSFSAILERGDLKNKGFELVSSSIIHSFFKKYKLIKYSDRKFKRISIEDLQNKNQKASIESIYDFELPKRDVNFYYDIFIHENKYYAFNSQLGELRCLKPNGETKSIDLYDFIDKKKLLELLGLNQKDSVHTVGDIYESKMYGHRFVDFLKYCPIKKEGELYFSISVNSIHELSSSEKKEITAKKNSITKQLKKEKGEILTVKNHLFLISIDVDHDDKKVKYYKFENVPDEYSLDFYSPFFIHGESLIGNIKFYPDKKRDFKSGNYSHCTLNIVEDSNKILFEDFSEFNKPSWYYKKKMFNNYSNYLVQTSKRGVGNFFSLLSYPFVVNFDLNCVFEVPYKKLSKIASKERSNFFKRSLIQDNNTVFINLGMLVVSESNYLIIVRSSITKNVFAFNFNSWGELVNHQVLIKGEDYEGFFCIVDNKLLRIQGDQAEVYRLL